MVPAQGEGDFDRAEPGRRAGRARSGMRDTLVDEGESPFDMAVHEEVRARVEEELRQISEPYRTTVILRDLEEMSYEEIAEITDVSLGTVKSRLTRGREALRRRLTGYVVENAEQLGLQLPGEDRRARGTGARFLRLR